MQRRVLNFDLEYRSMSQFYLAYLFLTGHIPTFNQLIAFLVSLHALAVSNFLFEQSFNFFDYVNFFFRFTVSFCFK